MLRSLIFILSLMITTLPALAEVASFNDFAVTNPVHLQNPNGGVSQSDSLEVPPAEGSRSQGTAVDEFERLSAALSEEFNGIIAGQNGVIDRFFTRIGSEDIPYLSQFKDAQSACDSGNCEHQFDYLQDFRGHGFMVQGFSRLWQAISRLEQDGSRVQCDASLGSRPYYLDDSPELAESITSYAVQVFPRRFDHHGRSERVSCAVSRVEPSTGLQGYRLYRPKVVQQVRAFVSTITGSLRVEVCAALEPNRAQPVRICSQGVSATAAVGPLISNPSIPALLIQARLSTLRDYLSQLAAHPEGQRSIGLSEVFVPTTRGAGAGSPIEFVGNGVEMGH